MASTKLPSADDPNPNARHDWFYMWIGLCITRWGFVETALFNLCHVALETPNKRMAAIVFYRTPSFEARLTLCDELLSAAFAKAGPWILKEWSKLDKDIREQSPIRNALAHYHVSSTGTAKMVMPADGGPGTVTQQDEWMEVRVGAGELIRGKNKKVMQVKDSELPQHYKELEALLARLWAMEKNLRKRPLPEFSPTEAARTPET